MRELITKVVEEGGISTTYEYDFLKQIKNNNKKNNNKDTHFNISLEGLETAIFDGLRAQRRAADERRPRKNRARCGLEKTN